MSVPPAPLILIADDDPHFLNLIGYHLREWSYRVATAPDKAALLRQVAGARPDLLLMDVRFGEHDGIEVLRQVLGELPGLKVAMLTAFGSIEDAISAMKLGAVEYLTKPVDLNRLRAVAAHAQAVPADAGAARPARPGVASPQIAPPTSATSRPILGNSPAIRDLRDLIGRVAAVDATALILGESGTGKELAARAIHELGPRRDGPLVAINVAALPRELVESTLFGHAKGAFTGADRARRGVCEVAHGGTLFLDEIGEMEVGLQAKLLRFLQERTVQRVGHGLPVPVDVRIIAATNRDPMAQVRKGRLREDLFYRLNVLPVTMPSLRDRPGDIPLLAEHFLARAAARCARHVSGFTGPALAVLSAHRWPGNVRELENLVERLAILGRGPVIDAEAVRAELPRALDLELRHDPDLPRLAEPPDSDDRLRPIDRIELDAIVEALARTRGNVRQAARNLGLGQATVYRKIKKYNIQYDKSAAGGGGWC